jgi:DNA repair exonuclease SbcCD ATPase subunit
MPTEPEIVNVLGEQVAFESTGFAPSEKFMVEFDTKYKYPGMSDAEATTVKKLFRKLFSSASTFLPSPKQPSPPCSDKEKDLLVKTLQHRFGSLRNELIAERQSQSDSLRLRQILDHMERMKKYLDFVESTTSCQEVDEDILAESLGDLSEEQIQELLKQFVFFILQGQHPLEKFVGRDPNPKGFVARLDRNPISNFPEFMDEYRSKKYPIPLTIAKVLDATKLDIEALRAEMKKACDEKIKAILQMIQESIEPEDPFWNGLDKTNLESIVDKLLDLIEELRIDLEECDKKVQDAERGIIVTQNEKDGFDAEKAALLEKLRILQKEFDDFKRTAVLDGVPQEEFDEYKQEADRIIRGLEQQIQELTAKIKEKDDKIAGLEAKVTELEGLVAQKEELLKKCATQEAELTAFKQKTADLETQLAAAEAKAKDCDDAVTRVKQLEKEIDLKEQQLTELRQHAGQLTLDIDAHLQEKAELLKKIQQLEAEIEVAREFEANVSSFLESLGQDKSLVVSLLGDVPRTRSSYAPTNDPILQQINSLRTNLNTATTIDTSMGSKVAEILKAVQQELAEKERQLKELQASLATAEQKIKDAQSAMEESNVILAQIRDGKANLDGKGFKFGSDKEFLEAAFLSLEAERALKEKNAELEAALVDLTAKNNALQAEFEAVQKSCAEQIASLQADLKTRSDELIEEKKKTASLNISVEDLTAKKAELERLVQERADKISEWEAAYTQLQTDSEAKLQELQEKLMRECEERLAKLREEEEAKRKLLDAAQGDDKAKLQTQIAELLSRITAVEGERDSCRAQIEVEKEKTAAKEAEIQRLLAKEKQALASLEEIQKKLEAKEEEFAVSETKRAGLEVELEAKEGELEAATSENKDLREQIMSDSLERERLFAIITKIVEWMNGRGEGERPAMDEKLDRKYGMSRILDAFLASLPQETEEEAVNTNPQSSLLSASMSRCYLVFFMTYVYSRHFPVPSPKDKEYNYQLQIVAFLQEVVKQIYSILDKGIPGKLEPTPGLGVPIQLKSKYMMNILLPLVKQMELIHEKGVKGADFLKFSILDKEQLEALHKLHKILQDQLKLNREIQKTINSYFIRRSGNVDDDILNLFLRFYHETKTNQEYPVVMYANMDGSEISKFTFASDMDFSKYLSSPVSKDKPATVSPQTASALLSKPVFSFNLIFYLFLFFVKDYLSSVEGELNKAGCPLPQILRPPQKRQSM